MSDKPQSNLGELLGDISDCIAGNPSAYDQTRRNTLLYEAAEWLMYQQKEIERLTAERDQARADERHAREVLVECCEAANNMHDKNASLTQELEQLRAGYAVGMKYLSYLANPNNWDVHDDGAEAGVNLIRPGGGGKQGLVIYSRNLAPWLYAEEALSSTPQSVKDVMDKE